MMLLLGWWGKGPDCIGSRGQGLEGRGRVLPSPSRKDHSSLGIDNLSVRQPHCLPTYPSDYLSARNTFSYFRYKHRGDEKQILAILNAPTPPTPVIYRYISEDYNTRGHEHSLSITNTMFKHAPSVHKASGHLGQVVDDRLYCCLI